MRNVALVLLLAGCSEYGVTPNASLVEPVAAALFRNPDLGVRALASQHFQRAGGVDAPSIPELLELGRLAPRYLDDLQQAGRRDLPGLQAARRADG